MPVIVKTGDRLRKSSSQSPANRKISTGAASITAAWARINIDAVVLFLTIIDYIKLGGFRGMGIRGRT